MPIPVGYREQTNSNSIPVLNAPMLNETYILYSPKITSASDFYERNSQAVSKFVMVDTPDAMILITCCSCCD